MLQTGAATFSAVWLFVTPILCAAGVLTHPCECSEGLKECGTCCAEDEEHGCDCVEKGCSHDGCDNDPCVVTVTADKDSRTLVRVRAPILEVAFFGLILLRHTDPRPPYGSPLTGSSGPRGLTKNLPYPPSDIPLLV